MNEQSSSIGKKAFLFIAFLPESTEHIGFWQVF
jgi:hypothetical protein